MGGITFRKSLIDSKKNLTTTERLNNITQEEIDKMKKLDESEYDVLCAEFEIIQRSIEIDLGLFDSNKSTD